MWDIGWSSAGHHKPDGPATLFPTQVKCVDGPVVGPRDVPIPLEELYYFPKFADVPVRELPQKQRRGGGT